jgi:Mrp family chromosome partitioning ATPase
MGRMLETLKLGSQPHAEQCVVDWTLREPEDVPYIEVGSGKKVEGSSQVMSVKHPAQPTVQPPHAPTEKSLAVTQQTVAQQAVTHETAQMLEAAPMAVVFEPWPAMLVPSRGIAPEVIAFHQPDHAISQQYATLFGKILEGQSGMGTKAIALTGCKPNVGTTTALLNLAVVAAVLDKRRLVLVDAHLMRPTLAQRLGLSVPAGLQEVLAGNAALEPAVVKTPVAGMYLIAARAEDNAAIGHLCSEALGWLLTWLKDRFDLVLIDGPSADEVHEIKALSSLCDGMYLVVPQGEIAPPHRAMAQNIGRHGGRLKGLIHTHWEV